MDVMQVLHMNGGTGKTSDANNSFLQVPKVVECNNSNICIASSSPKRAMDAYYKQFQSDFSVFPKSRAEEVISGGRMVLTMLGRKSQHPSSEEERCCVWELVGMALDEMVMERRRIQGCHVYESYRRIYSDQPLRPRNRRGSLQSLQGDVRRTDDKGEDRVHQSDHLTHQNVMAG
ncbi:hypothetical protein SAY87_015716 [Trapa incisa]|uniref:Uncharacterized protein n=1 Tax=Trapa incisa TaxID=236973 RepID=A0AAN7L746_9MYRT|nr:hypothetical protein SAY87_015716 [Trapa incisa]